MILPSSVATTAEAVTSDTAIIVAASDDDDAEAEDYDDDDDDADGDDDDEDFNVAADAATTKETSRPWRACHAGKERRAGAEGRGRALAGWGRASGAVREWVGAVASARGAGLQCWGRALAGKRPD